MCISGNTRRRSIISLSDVAEFVAKASDEDYLDDDGSTIDDSDEQVGYQEVPEEKSLKSRAGNGRNRSTGNIKGSSHREEKSVIQHDYHDHSTEYEASSKKRIVSRGGVTTPFPIKLYTMLEHVDEVEQELSDVVSWLPHGRSFKVHNPKKFAAIVLPRFFHQNKYASFQRQLNLYGFSRITRKGADRGSYYHEYFLRGKKFLCNNINRYKVKGTGARRSSNPDAEPDFYNMPPMQSSSEELTPLLPNSSVESSETKTVEVTAKHADENILRFIVKPMPLLSNSEVSVAVKEEQDVEMDRINSAQDQQLSFSNIYQRKSAAEVKLEEDTLNNDLEFVFNDMPFHSIPIYYEQPRTDKSSNQQLFQIKNNYSCHMDMSKAYQMCPSEAAEFDKDIETIISMEGRAMNDHDFGFSLDSLIFH